jgi:FHA domain
VIFVEVLDRRGRVRERVRLSRFPATVGRAYTNDVIVSDRFVSPEHCSIRESESGEVVVEDLGSFNGIREPSSRVAVASLPVRSGDRFRVGQTVLRIVEAGHLVAPAEPLPKDEGGLLQALRDRRLALSIVGASALLIALEEYLDVYDRPGWVGVLDPVMLGFAALGLWAGVWAFANRLLTHRFDFLRHLASACLASLALLATSTLSEYAEFASSSKNVATAVQASGFACSIVVLLAAHLAILPASTRRHRRLWAGVGTALLLGLLALFNSSESEETISEVPVTVPIKTLGADWLPAVSTRDFLAKSHGVREWVDEQADENGR